MGTMRGTTNRRTALRLVLALVAVWAFWQAAQPTAECTRWGPANAVEAAMPATGLIQQPIGCEAR